jgi:hypothetical protein
MSACMQGQDQMQSSLVREKSDISPTPTCRDGLSKPPNQKKPSHSALKNTGPMSPIGRTSNTNHRKESASSVQRSQQKPAKNRKSHVRRRADALRNPSSELYTRHFTVHSPRQRPWTVPLVSRPLPELQYCHPNRRLSPLTP